MGLFDFGVGMAVGNFFGRMFSFFHHPPIMGPRPWGPPMMGPRPWGPPPMGPRPFVPPTCRFW